VTSLRWYGIGITTIIRWTVFAELMASLCVFSGITAQKNIGCTSLRWRKKSGLYCTKHFLSGA
jgi:hypothetical protein